MIIRVIFITLMFCLCLAGSPAWAAEIVLTASEPDTKIYDISEGEAQRKEIGNSQLTLQEKDVGDGKILLFEKPGYSLVYVPLMSGFKSDVSINIKLKKSGEWTSEESQKHALEVAADVIDRVLLIQGLLDSRRVSEALPLAEVLKEQYPSSVYTKLVYANALFMSGNVVKADTLWGHILGELPPGKSYIRDAVESVRANLRGRAGGTVRAPAARKTGGRK